MEQAFVKLLDENLECFDYKFKNKIRLSKKLTTYKELNEKAKDYSNIIVGSD